MWELTQIAIDLVCTSEFLIQVCRKLPMSSQPQLSSRAPRSLDLLFLLLCFLCSKYTTGGSWMKWSSDLIPNSRILDTITDNITAAQDGIGCQPPTFLFLHWFYKTWHTVITCCCPVRPYRPIIFLISSRSLISGKHFIIQSKAEESKSSNSAKCYRAKKTTKALSDWTL